MRMMEMMVPEQVLLGEMASLHCMYDMEGEELYSVKWYKNGHEFFRYIPGDREQRITTFNLPGLAVERSQSDSHSVRLRSVNLATTGRYRCEVSAEAPLFNTVSQSKRLEVVALPSGGPRISGLRPGSRLYRLGETVRLNCTSDSGHPAPHLAWFVNGNLAQPGQLRHYPVIQHENGLQTAILGLHLTVFRPHLLGPRLEIDLRCSSSLTARVVRGEGGGGGEGGGQVSQHDHQEMARVTAGGSLLRAGGAALSLDKLGLCLGLLASRLSAQTKTV